MTYSQKLKDPRWQKRRLHILEQRGWKCERCRDGKTTLHVHHKKYRGEPWDAPDHDLEVLCEPCHNGHHGKGKATKRFSVYCAGKIGITDWRHSLFDLQFGEGYESLWASEDGLTQVSYAGPYFAESEHGSAHLDTMHGQMSYDFLQVEGGHGSVWEWSDVPLQDRMQHRFGTLEKCYRWMSQADCLFAYIDGGGAYGTCVEVAWFMEQKRRSGKRNAVSVLFASEELLEEYWFLAASVFPRRQEWGNLVEPDVQKAFGIFANWAFK